MNIDHRHRCEVRAVLAMRSESARLAEAYLDSVRLKRSPEAAEKLLDDCRTQWDRGNRGTWGVWR